VHEKFYSINIEKYLEKNRKYSKVLSIDNTFVNNKHGTEKLGRNVYQPVIARRKYKTPRKDL